MELTGFTENQFNEIYQLITDKIRFVDEILLTDEEIAKASDLVSGIDNDDAMFVALNNHLLANLWTGDKQLINGLKKKGYSQFFTTDDLYQLYLLRQLNRERKKCKNLLECINTATPIKTATTKITIIHPGIPVRVTSLSLFKTS